MHMRDMDLPQPSLVLIAINRTCHPIVNYVI